MDDYISREAAIKILEYARDAMGQESAFGSGYAAGLDVARNHIIDLPAADVRPVVQGKWKLHNDGSGTCGVCNFTTRYVWDFDNSLSFCPHCGADMRGGAK